MPELEDVAGIIGEIETGQTAHDQIEEVSSEAIPEGSDSSSSTADTENKNEEVVANSTEVTPTGETETKEAGTEQNEHSQTKTEIDWKATLPPAPQPYAGKKPEIDPETGQITNMTLEEYQRYNQEVVKAELRQEGYADYVEHAALGAAEQILPEIKTNPAVRQLVENMRVASVLSGQVIDTYEAAKVVRDALGIAPERISQVKAEAENNAKASITIQKNAALETGSSIKAPEGDKVKELQTRIKRGDDEAFAELLGLWEENGSLK
jgi:hypothetical protein